MGWLGENARERPKGHSITTSKKENYGGGRGRGSGLRIWDVQISEGNATTPAKKIQQMKKYGDKFAAILFWASSKNYSGD